MRAIMPIPGTGTIIAPGGIAAIITIPMTATARIMYSITRTVNTAGIIVTDLIVTAMAITCTFITFMILWALKPEPARRHRVQYR